MSWSNANLLANQLHDALIDFDWLATNEIVVKLIQSIRVGSEPFPADSARRMLNELRRKRRFSAMEQLAEALLLSGVSASRIERQFAQSLIDQGKFGAALFVLRHMLADPQTPFGEKAEALGLTGRLWKQWYLNPGPNPGMGAGPANDTCLRNAIGAYAEAWNTDRSQNYWQGINVCALVARAERHGIHVPGQPESKVIAAEVKQILSSLNDGNVSAFAVASALEVCVALNDYEGAVARLGEYVRCADADAFEIASTLRQFREVWELEELTPPGSAILPVLRSALLKREGGDVVFRPDQMQSDVKAASKLVKDTSFEAVLGQDGFQTLSWYKLGLDRCASVARIETKAGKPFGTGWLIKGEDIRESLRGATLLITNKHVLSPARDGARYPIPGTTATAMLPGESIANFQVLETRIPILGEAVWTSDDFVLDATIVRLESVPAAVKPLELEPVAVTMQKPPSRVYVIGHPGRRDLEFSMQDNLMLACDDKLVHYRAPTESGSSGSPVFEDQNWQVIALHHGGGPATRKLD
ncbi:MAG: trypsin-like peptidase domain-containing protein, partial [Bryobacteraceae bacterium]|nr:trypsin-like peptidase domain-containing protein [Bryobacteraceae bacterium]